MNSDANRRALFEQMLAHITRTATEAEREAFVALVGGTNHPRYGVDPDHPDRILAVYPDGNRVFGTFGPRGFEPDTQVERESGCARTGASGRRS